LREYEISAISELEHWKSLARVESDKRKHAEEQLQRSMKDTQKLEGLVQMWKFTADHFRASAIGYHKTASEVIPLLEAIKEPQPLC
jgi:hypothetical protein